MDMIERAEAGPEAAEPFEILADIAESFTFASYQNAIPVLRSITLRNSTATLHEGCKLSLFSKPGFLRPKTWSLDRFGPGDEIAVSDCGLTLDSGYLDGLNEAERGEITLQLHAGELLLSERHLSVRLLARDEWGGVADMAQLLPAFVLPNDPAVTRILRSMAEMLEAHGHSSALDGYQSNDPKRVSLLVSTAYSAISGLGLHYAEPPASFEQRGQKIRLPGVIAATRLATCLDSSALFAAVLEACGLHGVLLLFKNHAAAGVWLTKRTLLNAIEPDVTEIRKAIAARELVVFETTAVCLRPAIGFDRARSLVLARLEPEQADGFVAGIDMRRARANGITPLASHQRAAGSEAEVAQGQGVNTPSAFDADDLPPEVVEIKPTTAAGRLDRWQKKLLDLTLRNRLLNFPESKKTISFVCSKPAYLEDRLAEGAGIRIISLPEQNPLGERDAEQYRVLNGRDLDRHFADEALGRDELASKLEARTLEARLIDLHRQVRSDFSEGGTNTLFLAIGFLRWKKKPTDQRSYRAPLILVPVKLERRSVSSQFTLRYHEDEPRFNDTLLQFLEREFALALPQFSGPLPRDAQGVDVQRLVTGMRQALREVPGMEVLDEVALSTFSFAKFLMWKDLVDRTDSLRHNRVVRHLLDTPERSFEGGDAPFPAPAALDRTFEPSQIVSLLPADSSQLAAALAAAQGRDFVVIGPPGTGKSQTIANMIAQCLAGGKTVLFVAEKTAALNVVHRRLKQHGLGDHALELHSNKADRKSFLSQLRASWEKGVSASTAPWNSANGQLKTHRDALNAYVEALHTPHPNGLTPFRALGIALRGQEAQAPPLAWSAMNAHDTDQRQHLEQLAQEIGRVYASVEHHPALRMVDAPAWTFAWQERVIGAAQRLRQSVEALRKAHAELMPQLGLVASSRVSAEELDRFEVLAASLGQTAGQDYRIVFDPKFKELDGATQTLERALEAYRAAQAGLSVPYPEAPEQILRVPVDDLEKDWREAGAAIWPLSWLGQRRVKALLKGYASPGAGEPNPAQDLPQLRQMQALHSTIDKSPLAGSHAGYRGLETDMGALKQHLVTAKALRDSLVHLGRAADEVRIIAQALVPTLSGERPVDSLRSASSQFCASHAAYKQSLAEFRASGGFRASGRTQDLIPDAQDLFTSLGSGLDALVQVQPLLREWTSWCRVRQLGEAQGLGPLIEEIESGVIAPEQAGAAFTLAYARWWLPLAIDAEPVLHEFRRFSHEHTIRAFREIDELVRQHATSRVVSALAHALPSVQSVPRNSELGLLRHQMDLQRPSRSIREMIGAMPTCFAKLAPCMLMSPLSIAQYLPPDQALFDIVIFDEASQITTWDAVGAIARARQTIIVGDPRQLPPTNFFGRNDADGDNDAVPFFEKDEESILDEAKVAGIPVLDLRWHYRSRHESLIAFSNAHYYQNRLITFPAPMVEDQAVSLRRVPGGVYDRGKSRTNLVEARMVADEAVALMEGWLARPEEDRQTLGIITFNAQQQALIQDLLDDARRANPALEWFFADERIEPTIVKNLENVQGDERDVILFSITFARDGAGKKYMDFGALNRSGGERRLNVAVTRARETLVVFSGYVADDIDMSRTKAQGIADLKTFLDFAERGAIALPAQVSGSRGGFDSPFEEAVAEALMRHGWRLVPQVGISGYRLDLGVRHPDFAGAYLAGVECDGASYHSAATARDRDKVREDVLRGLGWNILRVWSTDWWFDAKGASARLHESLTVLLEQSRIKQAEAEKTAQLALEALQAREAARHAREAAVSASRPPDKDIVIAAPSANQPFGEPLVMAATLLPDEGAAASQSEPLARFSPQPERFFDAGYAARLGAMVEDILTREAPLREDILTQRIARAHGWARTGSRIRDAILPHLVRCERSAESSGDFLWKPGTLSELLTYRPPAPGEARRAIAEIPLAELTAFALTILDLWRSEDPARQVARLLGVERLTETSRARLDEALLKARQMRAVNQTDTAEMGLAEGLHHGTGLPISPSPVTPGKTPSTGSA